VSALGPLSDQAVSQVLQAADFGLATTPWLLREKSGSLAALREHGLPIVLTRNDWQLAGDPCSPRQVTEDRCCFLSLPGETLSMESLKRRMPADTLPEVAKEFLRRLALALIP
jgi:hypothetical protein